MPTRTVTTEETDSISRTGMTDIEIQNPAIVVSNPRGVAEPSVELYTDRETAQRNTPEESKISRDGYIHIHEVPVSGPGVRYCWLNIDKEAVQQEESGRQWRGICQTPEEAAAFLEDWLIQTHTDPSDSVRHLQLQVLIPAGVTAEDIRSPETNRAESV